MPVALRPSAAWRLTEQDGHVLVSGGADANYLVEAPSREAAAEIVKAWQATALDRATLSPDANRLVDVLVTARVVELDLTSPSQRVGVRFVGTPDRALAARLKTSSDWDLLLVIRTNGQLAQLTGCEILGLDRAHMLVDLAFNHVISFGPLVIPGETACLSCLAGRLSAYWGDEAPPARPAIAERTDLIASLIEVQVEQAFQGRSQLINQTLAYDLDEHEVKRNRVYKLPDCPRCGEADPNDGRIALPWAAAR